MRERDLAAQVARAEQARPGGPPPLRPFGLLLRRDAQWRHEGQPILNRRLRERFDRSVVYLPEEQAYCVRIGRFRGMVEIEETGFFVRGVDLARGRLAISDGSVEALDVQDLTLSPIDGAFLCRIKRDLVQGGLPARFLHAAQAELLGAVEEIGGVPMLRVGGSARPLPTALTAAASD
jgi:hypothetical protein